MDDHTGVAVIVVATMAICTLVQRLKSIACAVRREIAGAYVFAGMRAHPWSLSYFVANASTANRAHSDSRAPPRGRWDALTPGHGPRHAPRRFRSQTRRTCADDPRVMQIDQILFAAAQDTAEHLCCVLAIERRRPANPAPRFPEECERHSGA